MTHRPPRSRKLALGMTVAGLVALIAALLFVATPSGSEPEVGRAEHTEASPVRRLVSRLLGAEESPRVGTGDEAARDALRLAWAAQIREGRVEEELPAGVVAARAQAEEQRMEAAQARVELFRSNLLRLEEAASEAEEQGDATRASALRLRATRLRAREAREAMD